MVSSCSQNTYPVGFHMEADRVQGEGFKFSRPFKGKYYDVTPFVSTKMFKQYASFLNPDGSYGVVFLVEDEYRMRLYSQTQAHIGQTMLPTVNGLGMEVLKITTPIRDGKLVIWGGLNGYDLKMINETVEAGNIAIEKTRFLDKDPRPRPKIDKKRKTPSRDLIRGDSKHAENPSIDIPEG